MKHRALHFAAIFVLLIITTGTDAGRFAEAWQLWLYRAIPYAYALWAFSRWTPKPRPATAPPSASEASPPPPAPSPKPAIRVSHGLHITGLVLVAIAAASLLVIAFEDETEDKLGFLITAGVFGIFAILILVDVFVKRSRAQRSASEASSPTPPLQPNASQAR